MAESKHSAGRKETVENNITETEENLHATEEFAEEHGKALSKEEKRNINEKNEHRRENIENMKQSMNEEK
ncbi:hypothetical protein [Salibacterium halotolerans]|uniref:Small, acid-soluble spore protein Tlp n=1 Tax=Salibacterium halotolerans TaxID=1884432 RepID=A0A1I5QHW5_9BACI|nr:hypothetical protein [Salibacterium halotolerans]SFP45904.1 hypothetical protein SAMN05518683_105169 [Salibacterium halotolerans]